MFNAFDTTTIPFPSFVLWRDAIEGYGGPWHAIKSIKTKEKRMEGLVE